MTGPALLLALLAAPAQDAAGALPPGAEGPLNNDVFLPFERQAEASFASADARLEEARAAAAEPATARDAERLYHEAFDTWRAAFLAAPHGSSVWHPAERDPQRRRLTEGREVALFVRVAALPAAERARWRERMAEVTERELGAAAGDPGGLAGVEAGFPGTKAAVRAALALGDHAIAGGLLARARRWFARARAHADLLDQPAGLADALQRRLALLDETNPLSEPDTWSGGDRLVPLGSLAWPLAQRRARGLGEPGPGRGLRSGAVFLDDGRVLVQTPGQVHVVHLDPLTGPRQEASFEPAELLADTLDRPPDVLRADGAPGWPLSPATDGRDVVLIQGRGELTNLFRLSDDPIPNALVCLRPPPPTAGILTTEELPQLRWALSGDLLLGPDGEVRRLPMLADLAGAELQPGPLVIDGTVVVQVRSLEPEVRAWLLGLDLSEGSLRWITFLAKGSDLGEPRSRFAGSAGSRRGAGQALTTLGDAVFCGTHLGSGHLVDPLDGRVLWSFRPRRRNAADEGWTGDRPPVIATPTGPVLLWGPADSDRLYHLRAGLPDRTRGAQGLFAAPPLAIGEARSVLGGAGGLLVLQGQAGPEQAVFALSGDGSRRMDAVYLGRAEDFRSVGQLSAGRAVVSSDRGLYLFDLERELYLVDYQGLDPLGEEAGGEVFLHRDLVVVVGTHGLWAFRMAR